MKLSRTQWGFVAYYIVTIITWSCLAITQQAIYGIPAGISLLCLGVSLLSVRLTAKRKAAYNALVEHIEEQFAFMAHAFAAHPPHDAVVAPDTPPQEDLSAEPWRY